MTQVLSPSDFLRDACDHNVGIRSIDVNYSMWDCTLRTNGLASNDRPAMQSGMRLVKVLRHSEADAFASMDLTRQTALWAIQKLRDDHLPMFNGRVSEEERRRMAVCLPVRSAVLQERCATYLWNAA